ncbi:hypothetical protein [Candidatus Palauibacter sp.]|uniref:hypothetical protein n=1 Tax=Candidatus Palauibacter sp. TaxID=3101350 RepID=UPI003B51579F
MSRHLPFQVSSRPGAVITLWGRMLPTLWGRMLPFENPLSQRHIRDTDHGNIVPSERPSERAAARHR